MTNQILYKYRGLENFKFFADILLNKRLYAAKFEDMNDPMEGQYYYKNGELDEAARDKIYDGKSDLRICSLSKTKDNELMWSHYSEGHKGVVIGLRVIDKLTKVVPIKYKGLPKIGTENFNEQSPQEILSHKLKVWDYEKEFRVFVHGKSFVNIEILEVITGRRLVDYGFIEKFVNKMDSSIKVYKASTFM